jgi:hypothetical protein
MTACKLHHPVSILVASLVVTVAVTVAANASAQDEPPAAVVVQSTSAAATPKPRPRATTEPVPEPVTGLAMDARLVRKFGGTFSLGDTEGLPPVVLGYRGERIALLVGPFYRRIVSPVAMGEDLSNVPQRAVFGEGVQTEYGGTLLAEVVIARTDDKRTAAHALVGATLAETRLRASYPGLRTMQAALPPTYGLSVGVGLRHWLSPHFGVSAEIGEAYLSTGTADVRTITTFGALGVSLVL